MPDARIERFEALFMGTYERVHAYALRRAPADQAEDVVAETYAIAWRRLEVVPDDPIAWLYGTARRVLANSRRSSRRRERLILRMAGHSSPQIEEQDLGERVSDAHLMREALSQLSEGDREVLMLVAWEGLDNEQAAHVLGVSSGTVAVRLHRARRRLEAAVGRLSSSDAVAPEGLDELGEERT